MMRWRRLRSSLLEIFFETLTVVEKGTNTRYLPAIDNSDESLGPLVEIGSFTTCTGNNRPFDNCWVIFPCLSMSFSALNLSRRLPVIFFPRTSLVNFIRDRKSVV